jgi:hypothetical protein
MEFLNKIKTPFLTLDFLKGNLQKLFCKLNGVFFFHFFYSFTFCCHPILQKKPVFLKNQIKLNYFIFFNIFVVVHCVSISCNWCLYLVKMSLYYCTCRHCCQLSCWLLIGNNRSIDTMILIAQNNGLNCFIDQNTSFNIVFDRSKTIEIIVLIDRSIKTKLFY